MAANAAYPLEDYHRQLGDLQRQLMPRHVPRLGSWDIAAQFVMVPEPGGDYHDFFTLPDGRTAIVIGDCSGRGAMAVVMMAVVRALLHCCPLSSGTDATPFCVLGGSMPQPPHRVLCQLNCNVKENLPLVEFMTMFYGLLNPVDGILSFSNAGHPTPRLWRAKAGIVEPVGNISAPAIGLNLRPDYRPETTQIEPADVFVAFTRGLIEARNERGDRFGGDGIDRAILDSAGGTADAVCSSILDRLAEFRGAQLPRDDVTLVVLKRSS